MTEFVNHRGGCHCGAVRYEVEGPSHIIAWDCNCTICRMKGNTYLIVPASKFRLHQGQHSLSLYQFGTRKAKHYFCSTCGVDSFYVPRSNPDGVAVAINCLDKGTVKSVTVKSFDGENWDSAFATSEVYKCSQETYTDTTPKPQATGLAETVSVRST
uniref:Centromere protein v-like n=1 Tax=Tetraselmis sp. GSL018 TaxID=582737 RepID=A0A061RZ12_9CHLO|mmetsp:Transcript_25248/g.60087  ORF Transcript_25248/g.60087 Transcript_25248/m.60087 type:complete len:157 (-) Transcript_25248:862-1332(-)